MQLQIFSIFDSATEQFIQPYFSLTLAAGKRAFATAANTEGHEFHTNAADYHLFHLGTFHQADGRHEMLASPCNLGNALTYINNSEATVDVVRPMQGGE